MDGDEHQNLKSTSEEDEFFYILMRLMDRLEGPDFHKLVCKSWQIWIRQNKLVFEREFTHLKIVAQVAVDQLEFHVKLNQRPESGEWGKRNQDEKCKAQRLG
jgi:hypothetical protein